MPGGPDMKHHTLVTLVQNRPGVLNRVAGLFRRRGFNIESVAVGHSEDPELSRMTLVVDGTSTNIDQVTKQLYKLVDVVKVTDITGPDTLTRELALARVTAGAATRSEIMQIVDIFRAKIVDVGADSVIVEMSGDQDKIEALLALLEPFGVTEIVRTGRIAIARGSGGSGEEITFDTHGIDGAQIATIQRRHGRPIDARGGRLGPW